METDQSGRCFFIESADAMLWLPQPEGEFARVFVCELQCRAAVRHGSSAAWQQCVTATLRHCGLLRHCISTLQDAVVSQCFFLLPYLALTLVCRQMAWLRIDFIFYTDTQDHAIYHVWIHFIPTSLYPRREKTIWSELDPGPLDSQATALTTRHMAPGAI